MNRYLKEKLWLIYAILAALSWGLWGILTKLISSDISPFVIHFMFTIGMLFSLPFVIRKCKIREVSRKGFIWGISAGVLAALGNVSVYQSFSMGGQAAVVIPITNLYPIITIVIALFVFKEKLHWLNGIGILIVIPAIIILSGQSQIFNHPIHFLQSIEVKLWLLFALLSLLLFGLFSASQKVTTNLISAEWSYISFIAASILLSVCFTAFGMVDFNFSHKTFWIGSLAGVLDGLGVFAIYLAYKAKGNASQVSSIAASLQQVFTIVLAVFFLKEHLDFDVEIGIVLAILGSLLLSLERQNKM